MKSQSTIEQQVQCWLTSIIIELNFCPFAKREFDNNSIRYALSDVPDIEASLHSLADEFQYLDSHSETATTLLIFTQAFSEFDDFLELIDLANQLLDDLGYESSYQLAHFHPDYCFDGVDADDASNYTNRSPYPILHLLREDSLQQAIAHHPDASAIPATNIELARKMGAAKMQALLNSCQKTD